MINGDAEEYDTGLDTTSMMWEMLSELVDGEKIPLPLSLAILKLCEGEAMVVVKV